jgi:DNA-binding GntR family transcriptional regulator
MLFYLIQSIRESLKDTILEGLRRSVKEEQFQAAVQIHHDLLEQLEKGDVAGATYYMTVHFDQAIATFLTPPDDAETGEDRTNRDGTHHDK